MKHFESNLFVRMKFTLSKTIQSQVDVDFLEKITEGGGTIIIDLRALKKGRRTNSCQEHMEKDKCCQSS